MSERLLITGGTGFVGSHLAEHLTSEAPGWDLHLTSFGSPTQGAELGLPSSQLHQLDLTEIKAVEALLAHLRPDVIIHLAALASVGNSFSQAAAVLSNNIVLQQQLLDAITRIVPKARLLIVSSAEVYGHSAPDEFPIDESHPLRPINPYGVSKAAQDLLAQSYFYSHQLDVVRVRPFNHTGERQSPAFALPAFARQIVAVERGEQAVIKVGNLTPERDVSDVKDVVRAYWLLVNQGVAGEVYNLGSGQARSMESILNEMIGLAQVSIKYQVDEKLWRAAELARMVADASKLKALGWSPEIPFATTLSRLLNWWRAQPS